MKVFFQIKFSITAKEETQIEEELSNYVLTWLTSLDKGTQPFVVCDR